ncbi:MAG: hypothetical protein R3266_14895, partial [Gemmatimonadota bacterium]|nr:hypothetical protein [Gemmatimonadota bacterium]
MRAEYLLFDLAVLSAPLVLSFVPGSTYFAHRFTKAFTAILIAAAPFLLWDILVAGRHWWFADAYTLGPELLG